MVRILLVALAALIGNGCASTPTVYNASIFDLLLPAAKMYAGPERPAEEIAILTGAGSGLVRIDGAGKIEFVARTDTPKTMVELVLTLGEPWWRATHTVSPASIDAVDGEKVDTRGDIHVLPGVHEVQGAAIPCWDGSRPRPAARAFRVSVHVEAGHRYVIGSLEPKGLGRTTWSQPIVIDDDGKGQARERVRVLGTVVPCDG